MLETNSRVLVWNKYSFLKCVISHLCLFDVRDFTTLFIELVRLDWWHEDEQYQEETDIQTNSTSHNQQQMNTHWEIYQRKTESTNGKQNGLQHIKVIPLIFKINSVLLHNRWHINVFCVVLGAGHDRAQYYSLYDQNGRVNSLSAR